jgi:signal transduction histidine kinase
MSEEIRLLYEAFRELTQAQDAATRQAAAQRYEQLLEQHRVRLARNEDLLRVNVALSKAADEASILEAVALYAQPRGAKRLSLTFLHTNAEGCIMRAAPQAIWLNGKVSLPDFSRSDRKRPYFSEEWWQGDYSQPFFSEDLQNDPRLTPENARRFLEVYGVRAMVALLLQVGGLPNAILFVFWEQPHQFSDDERYVFTQLLQTLPSVVATRRAYLAEQQRARQMEIIAKLSAAVTRTLKEDELLCTVTDLLKANLQGHCAQLYLADALANVLLPYQAPNAPSSAPPIPLHDSTSFASRLVEICLAPLAQGAPPDYVFVTPLDEGYATLFVPMVASDRLLGLLRVQACGSGRLFESDLWLISALADVIAVGLQNARLYQQARQLAAYQERNRLARELHDSVSQALYGIALGARTARALLERDPSRLREPLDYVLSLAEAGLTEMRALIFDLRPDSLEQDGLVSALVRQTDSLKTRHHINVTLDLCAEPDLPLESKEALYWIAREALHNTMKHAQATCIQLRLAHEGDQLVMEVRDDGVGFEVNGVFHGHLGLRSMQERAARLQGSLEIVSAPNCGTQVRVRVPLLSA